MCPANVQIAENYERLGEEDVGLLALALEPALDTVAVDPLPDEVHPHDVDAQDEADGLSDDVESGEES